MIPETTDTPQKADCNPRLVRHAFPNRAGDHPDTDDVLAAELEAAGITVEKHEFLRRRNREVKTAVIGSLHGWGFERAWYYWVATGPGIELEAAEKLHAAHGRSVRVDGHCGCPSPGERKASGGRARGFRMKQQRWSRSPACTCSRLSETT